MIALDMRREAAGELAGMLDGAARSRATARSGKYGADAHLQPQTSVNMDAKFIIGAKDAQDRSLGPQQLEFAGSGEF
jgi:hypothetical protein